MQLTYGLFTKLGGNYTRFSTKAVADVAKTTANMSIEHIHDRVHDLIAGECLVHQDRPGTN
jgi:hypothetical protein